MQSCKHPTKQNRPRWAGLLLILLSIPMLFNNVSCTMFLIKEGYKEVKKIEEERKEKKEQQERRDQWESQQYPAFSDDQPAESQQRRHHGQWTPQREE